MRKLICAALALTLVACSTGRTPQQPRRVVSYGPSTQSVPAVTRAPAMPMAAPPMAAPRMAAPAAPRYTGPSGPFVWHTAIADAQAQARAEGKLILVGSTKPGCCLCEDFKNEVVPSAGGEVSSVAVGYRIDAMAQESPQVWQLLKKNLPYEGLMPLVGLLTPDLQWVTGFGGPADLNQLRNALAQARRLHPVSAVAPVRRLAPSHRRTAQLNEFGEYEWSPVAQLWPAPKDALTPELPNAVEPMLPETTPAVASAGAPAVDPATQWSEAALPVAAELPAEPSPEAWGNQALQEAYDLIQAGQIEEAKTLLARVHDRLPDTPIAREAAKGAVAVYNAERLQNAYGSEKERVRLEAERNLRSSMWGQLFS